MVLERRLCRTGWLGLQALSRSSSLRPSGHRRPQDREDRIRRSIQGPRLSHGRLVSVDGPPNVHGVAKSVLDSKPSLVTCGRCSAETDHCGPWSGPVQHGFCDACTDCLKPGLASGSMSSHRGERSVGPSLTRLSADTVTLYPGDGAYVPVIVTGGAVASLGPEEQARGAGYHIVVMPAAGAACEAAPGVWNSRQTKGTESRHEYFRSRRGHQARRRSRRTLWRLCSDQKVQRLRGSRSRCDAGLRDL